MSEPIQSIAQNNYILQAPPPTATMFTTELEYDGDKISGYAGSAFKAGTDLEFGYDSADNISAINNSAISTTPSQKLYLQSPLTTGVSGTSAYIGLLSADLARMLRVDETVLFSSSPTTFTSAFTASESISNFDRIIVSQMVFTDNEYITENHEYETDGVLLTNKLNVGFNYIIDNGWKCWGAEKYHITNGTDFTMYRAGRNFIGPNTTAGQGYNDTIQSANGWIYKVIGINRKEVFK